MNSIRSFGYLRRLFRRLFRRRGFEYDYVFEWTILKFLEEHKTNQNNI